MDQLVHQVDPDGDTLLILRNPNAPFLSATTGVWPNALPRYRSQKMKDLEYALSNFLLDEEPSVPSEREVHFRLSSKHLKLVSEYFQRMMAHNWMETNPQDGYAYSITAEDWDETALLIVMYVIHGQTERVPKAISIEMLAKIAVLVDYYNCHEAIDSLAKSWMRGLQKSCPHKYKDYGEELLMMLFASCIFPEADTFETLTGIAIWQSRGRIHTLGLPFPDNVVDALDAERQRLISDVIDSLYATMIGLCRSDAPCSFQCGAVSLGALVKGLDGLKLLAPRPDAPFEGYSLEALVQALAETSQPDYTDICYFAEARYPVGVYDCYLFERIQPIAGKKVDDVNGLDLDLFINKDGKA